MTGTIWKGLQWLFGGARTGNSFLAGLGAAVSIVGWMRSRRGPAKQLVFARNLREGEAIKVRFMRGNEELDSAEIEA
jgi:hypothetical protein